MPAFVQVIAEMKCNEDNEDIDLSKSSFAYFSFKKSRSGVAFLLECGADGVCTGGGIAGSDVYRFGCAGAVLCVIGAVGNIADNTVVAFAGDLAIIFVHLLKLLSVSLFLFWHEMRRSIRA